MAGIGDFFGYTLGGINWEQTAVGNIFGGNIKTVFVIVNILFVLSSSITLTSFREIPLHKLEADDLLRPLSQATYKKELERINSENKEKNEIGGAHEDEEYENITLSQYLKSIIFMPRSMQILCITNLLSWMACHSFELYFTDFVGEKIFNGDPVVSAVSTKKKKKLLIFWEIICYRAQLGLSNMNNINQGCVLHAGH